MSRTLLRSMAKPRRCVGKGCKNTCYGQEQLCEDCHAKRKLCQYPKCGKPHGGPPATTRYCPPHRAVVRRKPRGKNNPPWTEQDDALIRDYYTKYNAREIGPALRKAFPGRPRWAINRHAQEIGAATVRKKEPRWSPEEDAILRDNAWMSPARVQMKLRDKGFVRSLTGVSIRMNRQRIRKHIDGLTAHGLSKLLDVDVHAVLRWIKDGQLRAERFGTSGDNHDHHHVTTDAVRDFLIAHPEKIELSKIERVGSKMWFLELITHGRISEHGEPVPQELAPAPGTAAPAPPRTVPLYGERVTLSALADICGRSVGELVRRIDGEGMSVVEAAFGADAIEEKAAPSAASVQAGVQLRALMKAHRAGPTTLGRWTGLSATFIERMQQGQVPVVLPAFAACAEKLRGEVTVTVAPRSTDAA